MDVSSTDALISLPPDDSIQIRLLSKKKDSGNVVCNWRCSTFFFVGRLQKENENKHGFAHGMDQRVSKYSFNNCFVNLAAPLDVRSLTKLLIHASCYGYDVVSCNKKHGRHIVLSPPPLSAVGTLKVVESNSDQTELQAPELDQLSFLQKPDHFSE